MTTFKASQTESDFICEACGGKFQKGEGTAVYGFTFWQHASREAAQRIITRGSFVPFSVSWCHSCFDKRDGRRARRALIRASIAGPLVAIIAFLITLAASRELDLALMIALGIGMPITLVSMLMYLPARACVHQRNGRTGSTGGWMLNNRAEQLARDRGLCFMDREMYAETHEDEHWMQYPPI
jgi:hypothetical protein